MTQIRVFEQVGNNIQTKKQAEYTQAFEGTKQIIKKFTSKYCTYIYQEK